MTDRLVEQSAPIDGVLELTGNPARDLARSFNVRVILFLALHIPLIFGLEAFPLLSAVHALFVLLVGVRAALLAKSSQVLYVVAYIAGAEVLWRMTRAPVPWEYAKYATVVVVGIAIIVELGKQSGARRLRSPWPLFLVLALLPAITITLLQTSLVEARDYLSFNLSGYLALVALALYLWARPIDTRVATRLLLALIAPILSVTTLAIFNTATFTSEFLLASNWVTSGNFGPNQVSNVMGLAALASVMLAVILTHARGARILMLLLAIMFLAQAMLTFSRGGVYSFLLGFAVFGIHALRTAKARGRFLILLVLGTLVLVFLLFPWLNDFTGGALAQRLADLDTTGRLAASEADIEVFAENPLAGVGVGLAADYRQSGLVAHTEYTRLLSEHGLFGIGALLILGWMLIKRYLANGRGLNRGFAAGFAVWSLSIMIHSAIRIEVIPFAIALALVTWRVEQNVAVAPAPVAYPAQQPAGIDAARATR